MNREDINKLRLEAINYCMNKYDITTFADYGEAVNEKFAKLVAAAERENIRKAIAALHDSLSIQSDTSQLRARGEE